MWNESPSATNDTPISSKKERASTLMVGWRSTNLLTAPAKNSITTTDRMTAEQKKAVDEFKAARNADISGPFVPLLRSPEVMNRARAMGDYLRYKSVLPPRLSEFLIILTAREWTQNYEWDAHASLALKAGVSPDTVNAIAKDLTSRSRS